MKASKWKLKDCNAELATTHPQLLRETHTRTCSNFKTMNAFN